MAKLAKFLSSASGVGAGLDVDEVFSTYLYDGNNGIAQTINNGIDLSTNGGLVWIKQRTQTNNHYLFDTEATEATSALLLPTTNAASPTTTALTSFNTNGFSLGSNANVNGTQDLVSWTFRKSFRFFDVVTYTGTGSTQNINHSLGTAPGFIIVKNYGSNGNDWICYHRSETATHYGKLNTTNFFTNNQNVWDNTEPTNSVFTVGSDADVNTLNETYVAYLFAHNNGDGGFGPDNDKDVIKCGSYVGNATTNNINLGFEPQWVLFKRVDSGDSWYFLDSMRGFVDLSTGDKHLTHDTGQEIDIATTFGGQGPSLTPTGFELKSAAINASGGGEYIYVAIRRGPLAEPTSSSEVFAVDQGDATSTEPQYSSGFVVDMAFDRIVTSSAESNLGTRLTGNTYGQTQTTGQMTNLDNDFTWDYMNGWYSSARSTSYYSWMWRRAPSFFDVVTYTAGSQATLTLDHNLGVVPEMMWIKRRANTSGGGSSNWMVYHKDFPQTYSYAYLNTSAAVDSTQTNTWPSAPTETQFTVGSWTGDFIGSGDTGMVLLFASVAGVCKIGSYTGDGTTGRVIDCGFSNGPKFVLIKDISSGRWGFFDSQRGIVSGNDPQLWFDNLDAQDTGHDLIDTTPSGFIVNKDSTAFGYQETNEPNDNYIFYAIAAP
tara:strand:+ start:315 stop:2285 length:1971 start_codon:yes stop_codon:yes gene_type:complete